jgi:hypothetical protein
MQRQITDRKKLRGFVSKRAMTQKHSAQAALRAIMQSISEPFWL